MFYLLATFALLAAGITVNKYVLYFITPAWFVALRMLLAGVLLLAYNARHFTRPTFKRLREDWLLLLLVALCTTLVPSLLKAFGLKHMFAAKSTLLSSVDPFITALYAYLLWGERLTKLKIAGISCALMGTATIAMAHSPDEIGLELFYPLSYPELAVITSVALSRYGWMRATHLLRQDRYTPTQINGVIMMFSGLSGFLLAWLSGEPLNCDSQMPLPAIALFIGSIVAANVIGYAMYGHCLKHYSVTLVSLAGFLVPLFVATFAYLTLNEPLTPSFFLAAAAILIGLFLFYLDSRMEVKSKEKPPLST